jgi:FtsP/CotA-like multicopper oxidase with cupredoxin domain
VLLMLLTLVAALLSAMAAHAAVHGIRRGTGTTARLELLRNDMQVPTLTVTAGQTVTVNLTNKLPAAAGNTSILLPGLHKTSSGGVAGLLTREAGPGDTVTYTLAATSPGTCSYYSGILRWAHDGSVDQLGA